MAITICKDNKVEMPCNCLPPPPDKPNPILLVWHNGTMSRRASVTVATSPALLFTAGYKFQINGAGQVGYQGLAYPLTSGYLSYYPGYKTVPTITFDTPPGFPGPGLTQATGTIGLDANGRATNITITNPGAGYTPLNYCGYTISAEPLGTTWTLINQDDAYIGVFTTGNPKSAPVAKVNTYPPPGGWNPDVNSTLKCIFKIDAVIKRDVATSGLIQGRFLVNGIAEPNPMRIYCINEFGYTSITHFSNEITLSSTDILTYEFSTNDGAHIDIVSNFVGVFHPKTL